MSIPYYPTDWRARCDAKCRKTGARCPHTCRAQIPNTIAGHFTMDKDHFHVAGRPVNLCDSHSRSWRVRAKQLLSLPLTDGGHLSPYNNYGCGSVVISQDRIAFGDPKFTMKIPKEWGVIGSEGRVPEGLLERLPKCDIPHREAAAQ